MLRRLLAVRAALLFALAGPAAFAQGGPPQAIVVVADDGALEVPAVRAIRSLAAAEVRKRGITVSDDRRTEEVLAVDAGLSELARELGAQRIFLVRIGGRLGQKVPLTVQEVSPSTLSTLATGTLSASGLEEADLVILRLVDAVIDRKSVESTASIGTVTAQESKRFNKKPGERFWVIGLPVGLYGGVSDPQSPAGFSLGYMYEGDIFRLGVTGLGVTRGNVGYGWLGLEGAWIPLETELSPYIGGGIGYIGANGEAGMGVKAEAGLEVLRLHGVRVLAGVELMAPLFTKNPSHQGNRGLFPTAHVRFAF